MTTTAESTTSVDALIPSISLEALLARRTSAVAILTDIANRVRAYHELAAVVFAGSTDDAAYRSAPYKWREALNQRAHGRGRDLEDGRWLETAIASVDAALWDHLLERSGLRTFLDNQARREWDEQIEKNATVPLTEENIRATFARLHSQRGEFFERGVVQLFRDLSWDYKTNTPLAFGKKIIVTYVVDGDGRPGGHRRSGSVNDLERAFYVLDGKPEPDHRSSIVNRLWQREPRHAPVETPYFVLKTFQNGNGHVTFTGRGLELVDELNRILARHFPNALGRHRPSGEHRPSASEGLATVTA